MYVYPNECKGVLNVCRVISIIMTYTIDKLKIYGTCYNCVIQLEICSSRDTIRFGLVIFLFLFDTFANFSMKWY